MIHSPRVAWQRTPKCLLGCHVDPITITGLALAGAGLFGGVEAAKAFGSSTPTATPTAPPAPSSAAPPVQQPTSTKAGGTSNTPSFVGAAATPSQVGYGQKTLLGQ